MPNLKPETIWRRILVDNKNAVKYRLQALEHLPRPSLCLLRALLSDPRTPVRLKVALGEKYEIALGRRELSKIPPAPPVRRVNLG